MRVIDEKMCKLFFSGKSGRAGDNTDVRAGVVRLHGNKIAERRGGSVFFNVCGWTTRTTMARLNALLEHMQIGGAAAIGLAQGLPQLRFRTPEGTWFNVKAPASGWFDPEELYQQAVADMEERKEAA